MTIAAAFKVVETNLNGHAIYFKSVKIKKIKYYSYSHCVFFFQLVKFWNKYFDSCICTVIIQQNIIT